MGPENLGPHPPEGKRSTLVKEGSIIEVMWQHAIVGQQESNCDMECLTGQYCGHLMVSIKLCNGQLLSFIVTGNDLVTTHFFCSIDFNSLFSWFCLFKNNVSVKIKLHTDLYVKLYVYCFKYIVAVTAVFYVWKKKKKQWLYLSLINLSHA